MIDVPKDFTIQDCLYLYAAGCSVEVNDGKFMTIILPVSEVTEE